MFYMSKCDRENSVKTVGKNCWENGCEKCSENSREFVVDFPWIFPQGRGYFRKRREYFRKRKLTVFTIVLRPQKIPDARKKIHDARIKIHDTPPTTPRKK